MLNFLRAYGRVEPHVRNFVYADFCVQLGNAAFFLLINYYFQDKGFEDYEIAYYRKFRFGAVMLFAFPFGLFIKGRKLKPFFRAGIFFTPIFAALVLYAANYKILWLLKLSLGMWGVAFIMMKATSLPFIMLNAKRETHSEAIAMFFQTWIIATILIGISNFALQYYFPEYFDLQKILIVAVAFGFLGNFFLLRINIKENVSEKVPLQLIKSNYDWNLILKAVFPTLLIAVGAGFTIPFINLFFKKIHGINDMTFSAMGSVTFFCVSLAVLIIPTVKRKFGYKVAITLTQSMAIIALVVLATTEWYADAGFAVYLAVFCYIIRQPLMNVAGPMTSEMTMYYVGEKNQELISSFNASIWSGSWFVSAFIFQIMRESGIQYAYILLLTAAFYVIGVIAYYLLINDYYKRKELGLAK